jgi:hypothetical protein
MLTIYAPGSTADGAGFCVSGATTRWRTEPTCGSRWYMGLSLPRPLPRCASTLRSHPARGPTRSCPGQPRTSGCRRTRTAEVVPGAADGARAHQRTNKTCRNSRAYPGGGRAPPGPASPCRALCPLTRDIAPANEAGYTTIYRPAAFSGDEQPRTELEHPTYEIGPFTELGGISKRRRRSATPTPCG